MGLAFNVIIFIIYIMEIVRQMLTVMIQIVYRALVHRMESVQIASKQIDKLDIVSLLIAKLAIVMIQIVNSVLHKVMEDVHYVNQGII